jgi:pSer/pThr/pTyr-binding forkhead associated (FHA) protein
MATANVIVSNELKSPKELGVHFRFVCMTGPNKGKVYYLTGKRIIIGRGEKVDIQIVDSKISREHAELSLVDKGYVITDLSNQNGVVINDKKVTQKRLADGEKIVIGQTVIKYSVIEVKEPTNDLVPVENNVLELNPKDAKKSNVANANKNNFKATASTIDDYAPKSKTEKKGNSKVVVLIAFLGVIYFVFFTDDKQLPKAAKNKNTDDSFNLESEAAGAKKGIGKEDPEVKRKFDMLLHSGRREFREGNYFRAMEEFRRADLLIPGSGMAGFLMSRAKQRLDEDVVKNFDKANKDLDAKKYQSAIISYCGVLQLLQKYPEDERYKNAQDKILALEIEMGLEKGEIKCFEEKAADPKN